MNDESKLREYAQMVINGDYDRVLRSRFVGKNKVGTIAGYLSGVKKSIALLLYAAEKGDWVRLSEATGKLYISRSSAHKLLQRRLKSLGLVEIDRRGKWMVYKLTPQGEKVVKELLNFLEKVRPVVEREKARRMAEEKRREEIRKRAQIIKVKRQETPDLLVVYSEEEE